MIRRLARALRYRIHSVWERFPAVRSGLLSTIGYTASAIGRIRFNRIKVMMWLLNRLAPVLRPAMRMFRGHRVLFVGQMYYNTWYLSRALRKLGWKADVLNWNDVPDDQIYFHGEDYESHGKDAQALKRHFRFYLKSIFAYDVFHFSNAHAMHYGHVLHDHVRTFARRYDEVRLLRRLGKKIVYSNNACNDGVSQTSFRSWANPPICDMCKWRDVPWACSDDVNLEWGKVRNELADYQCTLGGNRKDYNDDPRVHEVPQFYCLDSDFWHPDLQIPEQFRLVGEPGVVRLYHAVGNYALRTGDSNVNIKSTHIYFPLVERLKREGYNVELNFFTNVPNRDIRYYQAQADIFLEMLTFGWFGANAREAMMLGKPVVCHLRPAWLESMRREIPEYVAELPIVNATPETAYDVIRDLVVDRGRREEIGRRGRAFAVKWHSSEAGARRLSRIYETLLATL